MVALLALICVLCLPLSDISYDQAHQSPWIHAANALPLAVLWLFLYTLLARPGFAACAVAASYWLLCEINQLKLANLALPLTPEDSEALHSVLATPSLYLRYATPNLAWWLLGLLLAALLWRIEPRRWRLRGKARLATGILSVLMMLAFALRSPPLTALYQSDRLGVSIWLPAEAADRVGWMAHFVHLALINRSSLSAPTAQQLQAAYALAQPREARHSRPDILVLQSESFFDPSILRGIEAGQFTPHLEALKARHPHGKLRVPTYGGLTTRTEFEVLTGLSLQELPQIQYPYAALVHRPRNSLPRHLTSMGYSSVAVHPYSPSFYRRDKVYDWLGFERFDAEPQFGTARRFGYYISDHSLSNHVIELLEADGPDFVFAVSIENHGPWDANRALPEPDLVAPPDTPSFAALPPETRVSLSQFLTHLRHADAELARLDAWVEQRSTPTLVLFYGDHLPGLHQLFGRIGFKNELPANQQRTPWILLSNFSLPALPEELDSSELAALLLKTSGISDRSDMSKMADLLARRESVAEASYSTSLQTLALHNFLAPVSEVKHAETVENFALIDNWGPRGREEQSEHEGPLRLWIRFGEPPNPNWRIRLGNIQMPHTSSDALVWSTWLSLQQSVAMLARPETLPLEILDPLTKRRQSIGEFEIRPRTPRVGEFFGWGGGPFCPIEDWGPRSTRLSNIENRQPDGGMGLWIKSNCFPEDVTIWLAGRPLQSNWGAGDLIVSSSVSATLLTEAEYLSVELVSGQERLSVGQLRVMPH
ncbi:LTA synthase family protein [Pseudomarimonas arenosa]|uniref:LTA synthase family protein n=1 Tax=Pseudomarimonas arenosa TaxID=2774145 RepID=A0AAW3ZPV3_9GAMM|nr:LTA synthase family protein [Pseudomarimonas arenosa]MBD8527132.1 LTA synthase family protein [Pseudomarimonas arenosa]